MSEKKEYYASTVEEAIDKAATDLNVPGDQLRFQVLDEGSTGFLGIGARDARITVENSEGDAAVEEAHEDEEGHSPPGEEYADVVERPRALPTVEQVDAQASAGVSDELIVAADRFMTTLLNGMGLDATVDAYDAGDVVVVDVATKETGLFIGRKGETIDAVQYLLNVVVYRDHAFLKKIVVDSEGYRQRRREAIQGMAHRTARRAVREKRSIGLPPMPAGERRVVHLFLKENAAVSTASEGEEDDRRVVVSPSN